MKSQHQTSLPSPHLPHLHDESHQSTACCATTSCPASTTALGPHGNKVLERQVLAQCSIQLRLTATETTANEDLRATKAASSGQQHYAATAAVDATFMTQGSLLTRQDS